MAERQQRLVRKLIAKMEKSSENIVRQIEGHEMAQTQQSRAYMNSALPEAWKAKGERKSKGSGSVSVQRDGFCNFFTRFDMLGSHI